MFHYIWREQLRANFGGRDSTGVHQLDLCSRLSSKGVLSVSRESLVLAVFLIALTVELSCRLVPGNGRLLIASIG